MCSGSVSVQAIHISNHEGHKGHQEEPQTLGLSHIWQPVAFYSHYFVSFVYFVVEDS